MTTQWTFDADAGAWSTAQFSFDAGDGSPDAGCLSISGSISSAVTYVAALSIPVADWDQLSFVVKFTRTAGSSASLSLSAKDAFDNVLCDISVFYGVGTPSDTTWSVKSGFLSAGTISSITFTASAAGGTLTSVFFDTVTVTTASEPEMRFLGLAADASNLYATRLNDGILELRVINLETLTETYNPTFGAATMSEIDNRERALIPLIRPGAAGLLFLRGRDGNNLQVQYSSDNGQTFGDVGDAGWSSSKVCAGLLADPLRPDDLVAVFDDDDLFQSEDNATTWSQTGNAPDTLRAAGRNLSNPQILLLAAQAADTLSLTNNLGSSFADVSDTVGTVNVIEVSRD
jgi:hypothetical protein